MTKTQQVLNIARQKSLLSGEDLRPYNIPSSLLNRLCAEGKLTKVARGIYMLPDRDFSNYLDFAITGKRYTYGVIALLSALDFHGLTTEIPHQIWVAMPFGRMPKNKDKKIRFITMSEASFQAGVETHIIDDVPVKIYSAAKTVADCFKFRNKIGLEAALTAFQDFERQGNDMDKLWHYAKINRVDKVMMPYLVGMGV